MEFNDNSFSFSPLDDGYDYFITDNWGKERHFKIYSSPGSAGLMSVAIEVVEDNASEPYEFELLSPFDADIDFARRKLFTTL